MTQSDPIAEIGSALACIWPDDARTLLLRACLHSGAEAEKAWHQFAERIGNPKPFFEGDLTGLKGLLPIVHSAARRNGFSLERELWTYLRFAKVREELRYSAYRDLCTDVLGALVGEDVPVIALKACALAETLYDAPAERHCHAIELLVPGDALARVAPIVRARGFRPARLAESRPGARRGFRHEHGLPLLVHAALFDEPVYRSDTKALWSASTPASIAETKVRILDPSHHLLCVLASAFSSRAPGGLRWACDAWLLMNAKNALDWGEFTAQVQRTRLALPVTAMLRYLAGPLGAEVPDEVLAAPAKSASRPECEAALLGALGGLSGVRYYWFRRPRSAGARRMLIRFLLMPSPTYIRYRFGTAARGWLVILYAYRPLAYIAQRLWWRALRLPGVNRFTHARKITDEIARRRA
ncbi:MAG: nucleotidyltransferase family protein [Alphaproteobacteria bacterium]